jgi:hypothetical protein
MRSWCSPGAHRLGAADAEAGHAEQVVAVARPALMEIQRPAAERSALRDQHAVRAAVGDLELGGDRVCLVLDVQQHPDVRRRFDRVLEQRCRPDARLPPQDQHAAPAGPRFVEQPVQHRELVSPTAQHRDPGSGANAGHGHNSAR